MRGESLNVERGVYAVRGATGPRVRLSLTMGREESARECPFLFRFFASVRSAAFRRTRERHLPRSFRSTSAEAALAPWPSAMRRLCATLATAVVALASLRRGCAAAGSARVPFPQFPNRVVHDLSGVWDFAYFDDLPLPLSNVSFVQYNDVMVRGVGSRARGPGHGAQGRDLSRERKRLTLALGPAPSSTGLLASSTITIASRWCRAPLTRTGATRSRAGRACTGPSCRRSRSRFNCSSSRPARSGAACGSTACTLGTTAWATRPSGSRSRPRARVRGRSSWSPTTGSTRPSTRCSGLVTTSTSTGASRGGRICTRSP